MKRVFGVLVLLYLAVVGGLTLMTRYDPKPADEHVGTAAQTSVAPAPLHGSDARPQEASNVPMMLAAPGMPAAASAGAGGPVLLGSGASIPNGPASPGESGNSDAAGGEPQTLEAKQQIERQAAESMVDPAVVAQKEHEDLLKFGPRRR